MFYFLISMKSNVFVRITSSHRLSIITMYVTKNYSQLIHAEYNLANAKLYKNIMSIYLRRVNY